jgi:hypothetical protein
MPKHWISIRVRPHFRFGSQIWNWSENFVSLRSEKKAWFHMIHFDVKHQKSEAKMKVKEAKIKWKNRSETKIKRKKVKKSGKKRKKVKKSEKKVKKKWKKRKIDLNFASLCFASKWSETFKAKKAKKSEKKRKNEKNSEKKWKKTKK